MDPAAVIEAARIGRVREPIVSPGSPCFAQREETINWAALATIRNSGFISGSAPTGGNGDGAILRFRPAGETEAPQTEEVVGAVVGRQGAGGAYMPAVKTILFP